MSAGLMHQLTGVLNLPPQPKGFEQHLKVNLVRAGVSAGLNMTIGGMKPEEALLSAVRMMAAGTLGGLGANEIAQVYSDGQLDYLTHKLMHALLGSGLGAILSEDIPQGMLSGALGGFFGEVAGEELVDRLGNKHLTTVLGQMDETVIKAQLMAAIATVLTGQDVGVATFVSENAIRNNSFLVKEILKKAGAKVFAKKGAEQTTKAIAKKVTKIPIKVLENAKVVRVGKTQSGISVTTHAVSRKIEREVYSKYVLDALKNPLKVKPVQIGYLGRPSQKFIGKKATVAINPETKIIISVNPTSTKLASKLIREIKELK